MTVNRRKSGRIVAIIDYRSSKEIKNLASLLDRRDGDGNVKPDNWRKDLSRYRSLIIYDSGMCHLRKLSASSLVRRMRRAYK